MPRATTSTLPRATLPQFYSEEHLEKAPERTYVIVPSTFEPGIEPPNPSKWGDFELLVFTDDDRTHTEAPTPQPQPAACGCGVLARHLFIM